MPFGERCGSIRPRASYMRSVCGCMFGELGGDRDHEHAAVGRDLDARDRRPRRGAARAGWPVAARSSAVAQPSPPSRPRRAAAAAPAPLLEQARRAGRRSSVLRERVDGLLLLVGEVVGHVDHEAVVDVALLAATAARASAGPRRAAAGRCRARSRAARAASCVPVSVGTSTSAPRSASGIVSGTSTSRFSPLRLKIGEAPRG